MKPTYRIITALMIVASPALRAENSQPQTPTPATEPAKKENVKPYKLDTCIVSNEKLGGMGKEVVFVYQGQEIKLCCNQCRKAFDKDPAKYLRKLEAK